MATYSMAQVETLTSISAHTLRIWERRYSFLTPERTETNIRYYSEEELKTLLNIGILIRNGHRISKVDQMSDQDIYDQVTNILSNTSQENEDEINALTVAMLEMDEEEFNKIFQRRLMRKGLQATITDLIYPFLGHIGVLWGTNKAIPAQEHFITNLIRQKIIAATDSLPMPSPNAPSIVMYLLDGEDHEIGLLLAAYIASDLGWRVYYLGQNVPVANIGDVVEIAKPQAMLSMFVVPSPDRTAKFIEIIKDKTDVPLLISGNRENFSDVDMEDDQVVYMKSPAELVTYLEEQAKVLVR
jgi:DNA-binding transcriptional MerR regulator